MSAISSELTAGLPPAEGTSDPGLPAGSGPYRLAWRRLRRNRVPPFLLGAVIIYYAAYKAGVLAINGYVSFTVSVWQWFRRLIGPWITLSVPFIGFHSRVLRGSILDAQGRRLRAHGARLPAIVGMPPSLLTPPSGCHFQPRCPHACERCDAVPELASRVPSAPAHLDRCWTASVCAPSTWAVLSVAGHVSDRIAVMHLGKAMELSPADALYTKRSIPTPRRCWTQSRSPIRRRTGSAREPWSPARCRARSTRRRAAASPAARRSVP